MHHPPLRLVLSFSCAVALGVRAQSAPATINYQGRLTDNTPQQNPYSGTLPMQFAIYDAAIGGTRLWQEPAADNTGTPVAVSGGVFNYVLGGTEALPTNVFLGATTVRYLQITLNPAGSAEALAPRQLIGSNAYAQRANSAQSAINADNFGGLSPAFYVNIMQTAFDSARLGGAPANDWQKALTVASCPANQFYSAIAQNGTASCTPPPAAAPENDPKVGTLTSGRVPRWSGATLADGTLFDTGARIGINTASPIAPLQVAVTTPVSAGSPAATGANPHSVFVQGRFAFVVNAGANTLQTFDISNPAAIPAALGSVLTGTNPRAVFVQGRYAYVTHTGGVDGLEIFDISNPAAIPAAVGTVNTGNNPYSLYVQGRYAYVGNLSASNVQVIDIANPALPVIAGSVGTLGGPTSIHVQGRFAYVGNFTANSLQVIDVSNPVLPVALGAASTGVDPRGVTVQGRYAYALSFSGNLLQVFDVANPASPALVGTAATRSGPYSMRVQGRYAYVVSYGSNQLEVFDLSNPALPVEVGFAVTGAGPTALDVQGRYAYVVNQTAFTLEAFDLGGAHLQQLEAGGIETGTLTVSGNTQLDNDAQIKGGLTVGSGGIYTPGDAAIGGRLSVGARVVSCPISAATQDCSCTAGELVISGGGASASYTTFLVESRPVSPTTWRIACGNTAGASNCAGMSIVCARLAP